MHWYQKQKFQTLRKKKTEFTYFPPNKTQKYNVKGCQALKNPKKIQKKKNVQQRLTSTSRISTFLENAGARTLRWNRERTEIKHNKLTSTQMHAIELQLHEIKN